TPVDAGRFMSLPKPIRLSVSCASALWNRRVKLRLRMKRMWWILCVSSYRPSFFHVSIRAVGKVQRKLLRKRKPKHQRIRNQYPLRSVRNKPCVVYAFLKEHKHPSETTKTSD